MLSQRNREHKTVVTQEVAPFSITLLEQRLFLQRAIQETLKRSRSAKKGVFTSQNSIWDTIKLLDRFSKPEYQSTQAKLDLLRFDAIHHAKEMALVEPITRFSYWHTVNTNETYGDGYSEDLSFMLHTFAQDLADRGLNAARASIEAVSFEKAKRHLTKIAQQSVVSKENGLQSSQNQVVSIPTVDSAILITSFPDDTESGYHGVDSKYNWDRPETHHSFFYLLQIGAIELEAGAITRFEIKTTQYRAWPNTRQALKIHEQLKQPITVKPGESNTANLLFANLIEITSDRLTDILNTGELEKDTLEKQSYFPKDLTENELEKRFKQVLYANSQEHSITTAHLPQVDTEAFWKMQEEYFTNFYLAVSLPVFEEVLLLQKMLETTPISHKKQLAAQIQNKIDYLDKAFFYYSKVLLGWIKINNTNPKYTDSFTEKSKIAKLIDFQQKLLLKVLGQEQNQQFPSAVELTQALSIDHRLATNQTVSAAEKKKLLSIWGFFSFVGRFSSLLQCGTLAPFTLPLSIMNRTAASGLSLPEFSGSLAGISVPDQQVFLNALQSEEYVELDLTKNKPYAAKKIYTVPRSYLSGKGCVVDSSGAVLGPCIDPETNERISLDDPRDTLAFQMTLAEFTKYIEALQKNIESSTLSAVDSLFESDNFSEQEKRIAQTTINRLKKRLLKRCLGLQDFISGDITNQEFHSSNKWLTELVLKLSFSVNPVATLVAEVEKKLKEKDPVFQTELAQTNQLEITT